eukprot:Hpha_TRINITY_DN24386_c0_g1::TRINITY_DN24386_c0_g1_i1::g.147967::m.147967
MRALLLLLARLPLVVLFTAAGIGHFTNLDDFMSIMYGLPFPQLHVPAVYITGVFEAVGGIALLLAPTEFVCRSLVWLVVLMTPANVNMWYRDLQFKGHGLSPTGHLLRGCAQVLLLLWLWNLPKLHVKGRENAKKN